MYRGRMDRNVEMHLISQEDAWERASRIIAMLYNGLGAVAASFGGGKPPTAHPREFNLFFDGPANREASDANEKAFEIIEREIQDGELKSEH